MKSLKSFIIALSLISLVSYSTPTEASLGGMAASPVLVTAGIVVVGGAGGVQLITMIADFSKPNEYQGLASFLMLVITVPVALLGLLILDEEQTVQFSPLAAEEGRKLGLTSYELLAYNSEIDQINALSAYVDSSLTKEGEAGLQQSSDLWKEVKGSISDDAFSGLVKVTSPAFQR